MINVYLINAFALVCSIYLYGCNTLSLKLADNHEINLSHVFFMCFWFILLSLEYGLRGNFCADYEPYRVWFNQAQNWNLDYIIRTDNIEKGFMLLNYLVARFTSEYHVMTLTFGVLTVGAYFVSIKHNCNVFWPPILILIGTGIYYGGFNLSTQMLAASVFAISVKFIYERKPVKYIFLILIAASIHKSALFLLPLYFISYVKLNAKNRFVAVLILIFVSLIVVPFSRPLSIFISGFIYDDTFAKTLASGYSWVYLTRFLVITAIIIRFNKLFDMENVKDKVIYLGSILCCVVVVFSMQLSLIQRFAYYFLIFPMIAYAHIIEKYKGDKAFLSAIYVALFSVMQIGFFFNTYYTYMNNL